MAGAVLWTLKISWHAEHFVDLVVQISWQARCNAVWALKCAALVDLEVQISLAQCFVDLEM